MLQQEIGRTARTLSRPVPRTATRGYRLIVKDFDVRIEEAEDLGGAPDFMTTFPPTAAGYVAAQDEAIAYLEDVVADCLEALKELKDSRWMNAMDLARASGS